MTLVIIELLALAKERPGRLEGRPGLEWGRSSFSLTRPDLLCVYVDDTYIPQYTAPQYLRVAHGLLITASCILIAWKLARLNPGVAVADREASLE